MPALFNPRSADAGAAAIAFDTDRNRWDIENAAHGLHMLLVSLIEYAEREGIDFDAEVIAARETAIDCR